MSLKSSMGYFPQFLTEEELLNPFKVVEDFFRTHSISESREFLQSVLKRLSQQDLPKEDLLVFFDKLDKLIEGMIVISLKNWEESKQEKSDLTLNQIV
jgi:hypothetical protein